jgi:hypothetical protein
MLPKIVADGSSSEWTFGTNRRLVFAGTAHMWTGTNQLGIYSDTNEYNGMYVHTNDVSQVISEGRVEILANPSTGQYWIFDSAGNLQLSCNTFSVNYANGTQVSIGGGGTLDQLLQVANH